MPPSEFTLRALDRVAKCSSTREEPPPEALLMYVPTRTLQNERQRLISIACLLVRPMLYGSVRPYRPGRPVSPGIILYSTIRQVLVCSTKVQAGRQVLTVHCTYTSNDTTVRGAHANPLHAARRFVNRRHRSRPMHLQ